MSRVLLRNVPHPAIGSRIPQEQLPPLGLLSVGGRLIDDGHDVRLIDGEFGPMSLDVLLAEAIEFAPDIVMFGHSGLSSGHPVIARCAARVRERTPKCRIGSVGASVPVPRSVLISAIAEAMIVG